MGFNTAAIFLNDGIRHGGGEFYQALGKSTVDAILRGGDTIYAGNGNIGEVLRSEHADEVQIVAIGGNSISHLGTIYYSWHLHTGKKEDNIKLLRGLADQYGFGLHKQRRT